MDEEPRCEAVVELREAHQGDVVASLLAEEEVVAAQAVSRGEVHLVAVEDRGVDLLVDGVDLLLSFCSCGQRFFLAFGDCV